MRLDDNALKQKATETHSQIRLFENYEKYK